MNAAILFFKPMLSLDPVNALHLTKRPKANQKRGAKTRVTLRTVTAFASRFMLRREQGRPSA
eukprot:6193616-Pleurochrysis_carterae.AAC.4